MNGIKLVVFVIFYGIVIILLIRLLAAACKAQSRINKERKQDKANGIKRFFAIEHVEGLGGVEKSQCSVALDPSSLIITCTGKEYTLPLKRIEYVDYIVDVNEIRYLKSSLAKGIAGAALFGAGGAVIGSAPKTKIKKEETGYAVICYRDSRGKEKIIVLKDKSPDYHICIDLVKALESCTRTQIEKVEL